MTTKTTEQAAEEPITAKEALRIATINQGMIVENGNRYYPEYVTFSAMAVYARSHISSMQATLSEYKQKVEALEGENAELLSQVNDATFEIQTGVDIVEGLQAENERLRNMLKYAAEGYSDLVEYQLLSDRIKNELQQVIDKIESVF